MTFSPTPEQQAIIEAARDSNDNLLISALAGAAKTSTLVLIAETLRNTSTLSLAFNKRIAVEMKERLPTNCNAMTLNGLGFKAWMQFTRKRFTIDKDKGYNIMSELVNDLQGEDKSWAYENFVELLRAVEGGKTAGYIPDGAFSMAKPLMDDDEFFNEWLEEELPDLGCELIRRASIISVKRGFEDLLDFNDQILLPTVFPAMFPQYPLVLVDEAQDLSALNHAMLRKLAKKRVIAVGDECQSIYGFRGAHEDSMSLLQQTFNMRQLLLSVSFRCPISVVEAARWRAPHMQYPDWAKQGEVRHLPEWGPQDLPDFATVLCRNNAPLFSLAIQLLKAKRYPELVGNDIGKALLKVMKKLGDHGAVTREDAKSALADWGAAKKTKHRNPGVIDDQMACITVFLDETETMNEAIAYAQHLFAASGPIKLMTGHKSKGLEFDNVFFLDEHLIGKNQQDRNLRYVIQTRAKNSLTYIRSEDYNA